MPLIMTNLFFILDIIATTLRTFPPALHCEASLFGTSQQVPTGNCTSVWWEGKKTNRHWPQAEPITEFNPLPWSSWLLLSEQGLHTIWRSLAEYLNLLNYHALSKGSLFPTSLLVLEFVPVRFSHFIKVTENMAHQSTK